MEISQRIVAFSEYMNFNQIFLKKQTKLFFLEKAGEVHTKYNFAWWLQVSKHSVVHSAMHARAEHGHRAARTGQNGQPAANGGGSKSRQGQFSQQ